jgi:hypothetical protein
VKLRDADSAADVAARAAGLARLLDGLPGMDGPAALVREAAGLAAADPAKASEALAEAASLVAARAPEAR